MTKKGVIFIVDSDYNHITAPIKTRALTVKELLFIHHSILKTWNKIDVRYYSKPIETYNGWGKQVIEKEDPEYTKQTLLDLDIESIRLAIRKL